MQRMVVLLVILTDVLFAIFHGNSCSDFVCEVLLMHYYLEHRSWRMPKIAIC